MEATEIVRKDFWKHRNDAIRSIDARRSFQSFEVNILSFFHVFTHIGDMNSEEEIAIRIASDTDRIVEILRVGSIDREREP